MPSALQWAYVGAMLPASYGFFGNLATHSLGVSYINSADKTLEPLQRVHIWRLFFDKAAKQFAGSAIANLLPLGYIIYNAVNPDKRKLGILAFVADFLVGPFTLVFLGPINSQLINIDNTNNAVAAASKGLDLLKRWDYIHNFRMCLFGTAWAATFAQLFI